MSPPSKLIKPEEGVVGTSKTVSSRSEAQIDNLGLQMAPGVEGGLTEPRHQAVKSDSRSG